MPSDSHGRSPPLPGFGIPLGITILVADRSHLDAKDRSVLRSSKLHLAEVGETYFEHLCAALAIAARLAIASAACAVHALVPGFCTRSASAPVAAIHAHLASRSRRYEGLSHGRSSPAFRPRRHIEIKYL